MRQKEKERSKIYKLLVLYHSPFSKNLTAFMKARNIKRHFQKIEKKNFKIKRHLVRIFCSVVRLSVVKRTFLDGMTRDKVI